MDSVFDSDKLKECINALRENPYKHVIYVDDTTDIAAYVLIKQRENGEDFSFLLCRQMKEHPVMESEIAMLSKCFDAMVLRTSFTYTIKSIIDQSYEN